LSCFEAGGRSYQDRELIEIPDGESSMLMKSEIPSLPAQGGRKTRTYECVYGHREWMTVSLH